jgi:hypothetical protein
LTVLLSPLTHSRWRHLNAKWLCISCRTGKFFGVIPAFLLVLVAVAYRLATGLLIHSGATWLSNFAPMAAIALCCATYFPPKLKFSVPLIALFISDLILNYQYRASLLDGHILGRYVALVLVGGIGLLLQNRATLKTLLPASILASTIFYLITCAFSWLSDPGYAKNFVGLIQALTLGLPSYGGTPAWMFFRNSLLSDLFFTLLFVMCMSFSRSAEVSRAKAALSYPV